LSPRPDPGSAAILSCTQVRAQATACWSAPGSVEPGTSFSAARSSVTAALHAPFRKSDMPSAERMAAALAEMALDRSPGTFIASSSRIAAARRRPSLSLASAQPTQTSRIFSLVSPYPGLRVSTACRFASAALHRPSPRARSAAMRRACTRRSTSCNLRDSTRLACPLSTSNEADRCNRRLVASISAMASSSLSSASIPVAKFSFSVAAWSMMRARSARAFRFPGCDRRTDKYASAARKYCPCCSSCAPLLNASLTKSVPDWLAQPPLPNARIKSTRIVIMCFVIVQVSYRS